MVHAEKIETQFVDLVQRLFILHPKLVFPDERVARFRQQLMELKASSGWNPEDRVFLFRTLAMLRQSDTPPTMGELSAALELPLSSTTRMADGLVHANFVERRADANDRRIVRLSITDSGRQFIETGTAILKQRIGQLLKHFSADEQTQLLRLMTKLIDSLQAEKQ